MGIFHHFFLFATVVHVFLVIFVTGQSTNTSAASPAVQIGPGEGNNSSQFTSELPPYAILDEGAGNKINCSLTARKHDLEFKIQSLLDEDVKLINYEIIFGNWTPKYHLATEGWARVSNAHGQTLKSMEFTHGVMSLMTLTLGQETLKVDITDAPPGCVQGLPEKTRNSMVLELLLKDFGNGSEITITDPERICATVLSKEKNVGVFRNRCCSKDADASGWKCWIDYQNIWLTILEVSLIVVRYGTLLYGPLLFVTTLVKIGNGIEKIPYKIPVPPDRALKKVIKVCTSDTDLPNDYDYLLDLRKKQGWPKLYKSIREQNITPGQAVRVNIPQYDVLVTHDRLVTEFYVPVGFWSCVYRAFCSCKLTYLGPFQSCCSSAICPRLGANVKWIDLAGKVGGFLTILILPFPYYIRLIVYYLFEHEEVTQRRHVAELKGVTESYQHSLVHYITPIHGFFILIYCIYVVASLTIAYLSMRKNEQCLRQILFDSFFDYKYFFWIKLWRLFVSNLVFPLKKCGVLGCLIALIYWPIVIPLTLLVCLFYHFPTTYITYRMIYHSIYGGLRMSKTKNKPHRYKVEREQDKSLNNFNIDNWFTKETPIKQRNKYKLAEYQTPVDRSGKLTKYLVAVIICILNMLGILLLLSECVGFVVELFVFTLMGIIVNAGSLLVYVSFIMIVITYCYDCFGNVYKVYQKLNKALFWSLESKLGAEVNKVTGESVSKQENTGFIIADALTDREKRRIAPAEQSEATTGSSSEDEEINKESDLMKAKLIQDHPVTKKTKDTGVESDSESSSDEDWDWLFRGRDDIDDEDGLRRDNWKPWLGSRSIAKNTQAKDEWNINDLVLFVDNHDMPRVPRKLFDEVCNIRQHGLPGPLYQKYAKAFKQLAIILLFLFFVFVVVQTFGIVYKLTTGNKLVITIITGLIPKAFSFLAPTAPDIEVRNMNFKQRLNQILVNFNQRWPVYDFPFEVDRGSADIASPDAVTMDGENTSTVSNVQQDDYEGNDSSMEKGSLSMIDQSEDPLKVNYVIYVDKRNLRLDYDTIDSKV